VAGKSAGFAIGIGLTDNASAGLDAINKRIAALTAPAERFNKSLAKFGEVTGINRAAEGIQTLGDRALGAARAVERLAGPMVGLTSLASLGGVVEMTRRWAEAGNQIGKTSTLLNTPVSRLSALRLGARLAGSSADALDSSLKGLGDQLAEAKWKGGPIRTLLNQFHIGFQGLNGEARTGADALGDVAEAVSSLRDPHAKVRLLQQLGISEDLLPLLDKGRAGLEKFVADARRTGGVMTAEMADAARKMHASWEELGEALEGSFNRISANWSGTATKMLDTSSHWIEGNKERFDRNVQYTAGAIVAMGAIRAAPWILRALGWLLPGEAMVAAGIGIGAENMPPITERDRLITPLTPGGMSDSTKRMLGLPAPPLSSDDYQPSWWQLHMPAWLGGLPSAPRVRPGPRAGNPLDQATVGRARAVHDRLMGASIPGMTDARAWGLAGNAVQESRADPNSRPGDMGAAHGLMMWRDERLTGFVRRYGHLPQQGTLDEAIDYIKYELTGPEAEAWRKVQMAGDTPGEAGAAVSTFYERPKDTADEEARRWAIAQALSGMAPNGVPGTGPVFGAQRNVSGSVRVDVHLHGAPPGTTASVTASGQVNAPPPKIETSMPLAR
jgi:hypothetical protein